MPGGGQAGGKRPPMRKFGAGQERQKLSKAVAGLQEVLVLVACAAGNSSIGDDGVVIISTFCLSSLSLVPP
jgi:hypothetical protein